MTSPTPTMPRCRHRAQEAAPGVHHCVSPKLVGLKLVDAAVCGKCHYRDHEPFPQRGNPVRLLNCSYWAPESPVQPGRTTPGCSHPNHQNATLKDCVTCPDYLFPLLSPLTPVEWIRRSIGLPPRTQVEGWWHWPNVQEAYRLAANESLRALSPYPGSRQQRGVVVVGGGRYFVSAYVTIRVLRHVGCQLPIELWHLAGEVDEAMRQLVKPLGVECRDGDAEAKRQSFRFLQGNWWKGWQLKPFAVANSSFQEVLMLDADSYPTRDPESLFHWADYRQHGAIFWPDLPSSAFMLPAEKWAVFGAPPRHPPFESGQLLIDRKRCWNELQLALWYNAQADFVYRLLWGDKDTFNIAWSKLGREYAMPQPNSEWSMHTILQYDPEGQVLFQHRCQDKFRLEKTWYDSTCQPYEANTFNPRLAHEAACFGFLEELKRHWKGGEPSQGEPP